MGVGIGDTDIFDFGGLIGAVIGTIIVLAFANWYFRRQAAAPPLPATGCAAANSPTPRAVSIRRSHDRSEGLFTFSIGASDILWMWPWRLSHAGFWNRGLICDV